MVSSWCADTLGIASLCYLIWELMFYKFEQGHNFLKATKSVCCVNGEVAIDHSSVMIPEILLGL